MTRTDCLKFALLASTALSAVPALAGDRLPTGASVAHGDVAIATPSANAMAIRQSSDTAIVNWRGFSIGEGARVDIRQPSASSAMLNRVTGSTPSSIAGQLNANGQVYLVNPNGIAITPTGTVRTGAFVASTLATTDEDFIAGRRSFRGDGRSAAVSNQGSIEVGPGGYAALLGGKVENSGQITARLGRIGLGAAEQATLDLSGDAFLQVAVPSDGDDDDPLITHSGRLSADGGRVEIKAATARQMARQVINLSGVVEARSVSGRSGAIVLGGGSGGRVRVTGRLDAGAAPAARPEPLAAITPPPPRPDKGGSITVTGDAVELAGATLDASGPAGGGTVRVGGDYQGKGALPRARTTTVDAATLITADALGAGDGGRVIVWSDERTAYEGAIRARGGPDGGDGGFAEVSGKDRLWFAGTVDLSAPSGTTGTLLLDPTDISIVEDPAGDNEIAAGTIETILGDVNFTVSTASEDDEAGDITVEAPLAWAGINTLTLDADNDIVINAAISAPDGGLTLAADGGTIGINAPISIAQLSSNSAGTTTVSAPITGGDGSNFFFGAAEGSIDVRSAISLGEEALLTFASGADLALDADITWDAFTGVGAFATGDITIAGALSGPSGDLDVAAGGTITPDGPIDVGTFTLTSGDWIQLGAALPAFSAADFRIEDGEAGDASFLRALEGDGTAAAPYFITDAYGLQGIGSADEIGATVPDLSDSYALANTIDATGTAGWNDVEGAEGFEPIGDLDVPFLGTLDGQGFAVGGLFIDRPFDEAVGLFASVGFGGAVQDLELTDASIEGGPITGGIAGANEGVISQTRMTRGSVTGGSGGDDDFLQINVGGLVGQNASAVTRSTSSASVSGNGFPIQVLVLGGLVGMNEGTVSDSFATGPVEGSGAGTMIAGGLVGLNQPEARILRTYASGSVTTTEATNAAAGGLVGSNAGTIGQSYAVGAVTGPAGGALGGLVGSFFTPGPAVAAISPPVDGVSASWFDTTTTGQATSAGGFAIATTDFQDTESFMAAAELEEWSFTGTWAPPSPGFYPELYSVSPVVWMDIADATAVYGFPAGFVPPSTRSGGPEVFAFGPAGDSLGVPLAGPPLAGAGVGEYAISAAPAATSALGVPYRVVATDGILTVTPAPLTITAADRSKRYGRSLGFRGTEFTARGLVNGDTVTSVDLASPGAARGVQVGEGPFRITASNAEGDGLVGARGTPNYTIRYVEGRLTVTPAPLVVTADDQYKRFGQAFVFNGTEFTTRGLLNADDVTSALLRSDGAPATALPSPYAIEISGAQGTGLSFGGVLNYDITYVPGELSVIPLPQQILPNLSGLPTFDAGLRLVYYDDLPNPPDEIEIAGTEAFTGGDTGTGTGGGTGGPTLGPSRPAAGGAAATVARETAEDTLSFLEALSGRLETRVSACNPVPPNTDIFLACVRDALADYASELDSRILDLPPPLRSVSAVIRQSASQIEGVRADAARRIALATSDAEVEAIQREAALRAGAAVQTAVVEIRKAIELIRAEDDPQLASLQSRQGAAITAALQNVEDELSQAVGL